MATSALKGKARAIVAAPLTQQLEMLRAPARIASNVFLRRHNSTAAAVQAAPANTHTPMPSNVGASTSASTSAAASLLETVRRPQASGPGSASEATPIAESAEALGLLRSQRTHYVVASIAGRTLMLHERDLFTLPRINDLQVGDVIELDRVHEVGSRDYTLRAQNTLNTRTRGAAALTRRSNIDTPQLQTTAQGSAAKVFADISTRPDNAPQSDTVHETTAALIQTMQAMNMNLKESQSWAARLRPGGLAHVGAILPESTVRVRCTVVEHTKGRMEFKVKFKRRKGYKRTIKHKQTYTRLRVDAIQLGQGV